MMTAQGPWFRIEAIPVPERISSAEWDFVTVLPAVLSAAQQRRPFVVGWLSRGGGSPLELVTNAGSGDGGLLFPNGARGRPCGDGWLQEAARMVWTRCPGRQAPPLATAQERSSLFEQMLVTLLGRPFGWLVTADPCPEQLLDAEIRELRHELRILRRDDQSGVERAERRLAELDSFREAGLWNVRVLAGAGSPGDLEQIAPVLVGSMELGHHPYRLRTGRQMGAFAEAMGGSEEGFPFVASAGALAALAGLPRREVPGVRVLDSGYFDVTSETSGGGLELGAILDGQDRTVGRFTVPLETLNRHAFVTGATGSGKSQTVRHILEQLTHAGVPWLAIEPAKSEYAAMAGRIGAPVTVVNPSDPGAVPMSLNPLAPEPGYPVQAHIDMVRALFQAAFDAEEPFPQIIAQALQRVYEACGWDVVTGGGRPGPNEVPPSVPTLEQLQQAALDVIADVGYGKELMSDVKGFVDVRLRSLRIGSAGRFFEGGHDADIGGLLRENVVLAIEDVANDEDKAFLMGTLIIRVVEHLRMRARTTKTTGLRHVIVIEEAHRLLRNRDSASAHAVELFAGLLAEIRAYGEGIVVAEQIPVKLIPDVVKNTALKIVHRLPAYDDRHVVGSAMNLDADQSREVVSLRPGVAAVFADGMDRPLRIRVPWGEDREELLPGPPPPISGRRSVACGTECKGGRACTLRELREADLLASSAEQAWLRLWTDVLILGHLTNRPLPAVPPELGRAWSRLAPRLRECMLATVLDHSVGRRALALRTAYDPAALTTAATEAATSLLNAYGARPAPEPPGPLFVIPQLRWLHELDKLFPLDAAEPDPHGMAPPLDYVLPGLRQQSPDAKMGQRLRSLRRHPLSTDLPANRPVALTALQGTPPDTFEDDLATITVGLDPSTRLDHLTASLHTPWLESVLTWPDRFIDPPEDDAPPPHHPH
ncbi:ATP-binding protein [Actinocorallia longicatena]